MRIDARIIRSKETVEGYITAVPTPRLPVDKQAGELFTAIRDSLRSNRLHLLQERVFGTKIGLYGARKIRTSAYGDVDDGLEPSWLVVPEGVTGPLAGVQVHAVSGDKRPELLRLDNVPCGRIFHRNSSGSFITLSGISACPDAPPGKQARVAFEKAEAALRQVNAGMLNVPRTWMWLADILSWYGDFNEVRNKFYTEQGLITNGSLNRMPASTGIGIGSDNAAACAMDFIAVINPARPIEYFNNAGKQNSAFKYGSAFSRAATAVSPAGITAFVSGTASIDASGKTIHIDNAPAQIETTIENVRAVLRQVNFNDDNVVQAIAYCKTPEIERLFCEKLPDLPWPILTAIADVCRPDLLFEIELTAAVAG